MISAIFFWFLFSTAASSFLDGMLDIATPHRPIVRQLQRMDCKFNDPSPLTVLTQTPKELRDGYMNQLTICQIEQNAKKASEREAHEREARERAKNSPSTDQKKKNLENQLNELKELIKGLETAIKEL